MQVGLALSEGKRDRERPAKNHRFVTASHVVRSLQGAQAQPPEDVRCYLTFQKWEYFGPLLRGYSLFMDVYLEQPVH